MKSAVLPLMSVAVVTVGSMPDKSFFFLKFKANAFDLNSFLERIIRALRVGIGHANVDAALTICHGVREEDIHGFSGRKMHQSVSCLRRSVAALWGRRRLRASESRGVFHRSSLCYGTLPPSRQMQTTPVPGETVRESIAADAQVRVSADNIIHGVWRSEKLLPDRAVVAGKPPGGNASADLVLGVLSVNTQERVTVVIGASEVGIVWAARAAKVVEGRKQPRCGVNKLLAIFSRAKLQVESLTCVHRAPGWILAEDIGDVIIPAAAFISYIVSGRVIVEFRRQYDVDGIEFL